MIASLAGNLFNIVFDYVLVFPCNLDMLGAALATGFSPIVSILILSLHVIRKKNTFHCRKTKLSLRTYGGICSLGLAPFINELSFAAVLMVFNGLFKRLGGDTAIAAYAIIINVFYVVNSVFNGIANGTQPMISFSYGQSDHQKSVAYCATPSSPSPPLPSCCILQYSSGRTESQASSTRKA